MSLSYVRQQEYQSSNPVAHRCWRATASSLVLSHNIDSPFRLNLSFAARVTSPRQHLPDGFLTSQAQLPAFTSVLIRSATVDGPVSAISFSMSFLVNPKQ